LNRSTIHNVIDVALSGDKNKKNIVNPETLSSGTFFATLFDGVTFSDEIKKLYQKNENTLARYIVSNFGNSNNYTSLIASYYSSEDRNKRLEQKGVPFYYELGAVSLDGKE